MARAAVLLVGLVGLPVVVQGQQYDGDGAYHFHHQDDRYSSSGPEDEGDFSSFAHVPHSSSSSFASPGVPSQGVAPHPRRHDTPLYPSCPVCPLLEFQHSLCPKADKDCCLATTASDMPDSYPFVGQSCPSGSAVSAAEVCAGLEANEALVAPGTRLLPAATISTTDSWEADRFAAVAAIGNAGLCFNVFTQVTPGQELGVTCDSPLVNDPTNALANLVSFASIATGGNVVIRATPTNAQNPSFDGAVIVLGDFTVLEAPVGVFNIANQGVFTGPDAFLNLGAVFGGEITFAEGVAGVLLNVNNGGMAGILIGDGSNSQMFAQEPTVISAAELAMLRQQFDAYLCSAFNQITELSDNGQAAFTNDGADLDLNCAGVPLGTICVISMTSDQLRGVETLTVTLSGNSGVLVKVSGSGNQYFEAPTCVASGACEDALFVFTEADGVNVVLGDTNPPPIFPLFAPVASTIFVKWLGLGEVQASGFIARTGSTMTLTNGVSIDAIGQNSQFTWILPVLDSQYDVVLCTCACDTDALNVEVEDRQCLVKTGYENHHQPYHHHHHHD